jgi:thiamine-phosphate pyrophosphorylase
MRLRGLYAITAGDTVTALGLAEQVAQAIAGGARVIQYRDKSGDPIKRLGEAEALNRLCRAHGVPLLINDDVGLAQQVGAAGVHLGRDDASVAQARVRLGADAIIGVSCYNDFARAERAAAAGADYVAFGSFFPSPTKPEAVRADLVLLQRARRELAIPAVAIGGITPENGRALIDAGAAMLAVITGVFGQPDIRAAARAYSRLFADRSPATEDPST